jgi:hypothetical protein
MRYLLIILTFVWFIVLGYFMVGILTDTWINVLASILIITQIIMNVFCYFGSDEGVI